MGDWIGLGFIVLVVVGVLFGLSHLGKPAKPLSKEEYERRVREGTGALSAGVMGQWLVNEQTWQVEPYDGTAQLWELQSRLDLR